MRGERIYIGIDVGSVSTNLVAMTEGGEVVSSLYLLTRGRPIEVVQEGLEMLGRELDGAEVEVAGVGTTGSGRQLAAVVVGADVVKNEITCHAVATSRDVPGVRTIIEIGGQDSKLILLRDGVITDFAMNTVCAAGTGSFLDRQAQRLGIPIEEFGKLALRSKNPCRIAGRCTVFAESDMIHKQQLGHKVEDIVAGLCEAIARNYLNNLAKGKRLEPPFVFQGGVAANVGVKAAFEKLLGHEVIVPKHHKVMGAIGAAILAKEFMARRTGRRSKFRGFEVAAAKYEPRAFICTDCANNCEVVEIYMNGKLVGRWGCRCCKWSHLS